MSKAVLLSIKPHYCELIASGKKTIEVRKTKPKIDTPFKCYIYCTKGEHLWKAKDRIFFDGKYNRLIDDMPDWLLNGKVVGEFVCDKVDCYPFVEDEDEIGMIYPVSTAEGEKTCLEYDEVEKYGAGKPLYFWHISDLVIYDKPKELREFYTFCDVMRCEYCDLWGSVRVNAEEFDMDCKSDWFMHKPLKRPPQSWCYVEEID